MAVGEVERSADPAANARAGRAWRWTMVLVTGGALISAAALAPGRSGKPGHLLVWLLFVGSSVHVASTGWFITSPDVRRHAVTNDRRGLIGLPLCCVVACGVAALLVPVHLLNWVLLAVFAWQFHHFQKQNLGLVALAASSAGLRGPRPLERRLIMFAGICGIAALAERSETLATRHVSPTGCRHGDRVHGVRRGAAWSGRSLCFAARGKRPASYCALYLTALLFPLPIFIFRSPYAAVSGMTIGHGLQYLILMGLVAQGGRTAGRRHREFAWVCAIALAGGVALERRFAPARVRDGRPPRGVRPLRRTRLRALPGRRQAVASQPALSQGFSRGTSPVPGSSGPARHHPVADRSCTDIECELVARSKSPDRQGRRTPGFCRVRALCRAGDPDPLQLGRGPQARLRADQGHRALRRRAARTGDAVRGAQPPGGPGPH